MWQYLLFTLLSIGYISAFNVDTKSPIILNPNGYEGLFGHSISISEDGDVIIGAPESQTHGNVFLCPNVKDQSPMYCDKLGKCVYCILTYAIIYVPTYMFGYDCFLP